MIALSRATPCRSGGESAAYKLIGTLSKTQAATAKLSSFGDTFPRLVQGAMKHIFSYESNRRSRRRSRKSSWLATEQFAQDTTETESWRAVHLKETLGVIACESRRGWLRRTARA